MNCSVPEHNYALWAVVGSVVITYGFLIVGIAFRFWDEYNERHRFRRR